MSLLAANPRQPEESAQHPASHITVGCDPSDLGNPTQSRASPSTPAATQQQCAESQLAPKRHAHATRPNSAVRPSSAKQKNDEGVSRRTITNRQSAMRSKERQRKYVIGLEQSVKELNQMVAKQQRHLHALAHNSKALVSTNRELAEQLTMLRQRSETHPTELIALRAERSRLLRNAIDPYASEATQADVSATTDQGIAKNRAGHFSEGGHPTEQFGNSFAPFAASVEESSLEARHTLDVPSSTPQASPAQDTCLWESFLHWEATPQSSTTELEKRSSPALIDANKQPYPNASAAPAVAMLQDNFPVCHQQPAGTRHPRMVVEADNCQVVPSVAHSSIPGHDGTGNPSAHDPELSQPLTQEEVNALVARYSSPPEPSAGSGLPFKGRIEDPAHLSIASPAAHVQIFIAGAAPQSAPQISNAAVSSGVTCPSHSDLPAHATASHQLHQMKSHGIDDPMIDFFDPLMSGQQSETLFPDLNF